MVNRAKTVSGRGMLVGIRKKEETVCRAHYGSPGDVDYFAVRKTVLQRQRESTYHGDHNASGDGESATEPDRMSHGWTERSTIHSLCLISAYLMVSLDSWTSAITGVNKRNNSAPLPATHVAACHWRFLSDSTPSN